MSYALDANTVVADLGMVPNQPLAFADSKDKRRSEDDLIAYTRVKHFATKDDTWLVRLAMVKSGVRAMDAVQEFLASEAGGRLAIDRFVVSGGSKRGWTAWLVGAVDRRVTAIMPTVIDALNSEAITRHHFEALGFFSSALDDYVRHGLFPHKIGTPEYRAVLAIEDPYNYRHRERLKIPKYLVNASGDQYFLPDNSQFYFNDLEGEKYLRYVPNARHNLAGSDARESLLAFYQAVLANRARPRFSWTKSKDGSLRVEVTDKPRAVTVWQASNPKARDFRVDTIGTAYTQSALAEQSPGVYVTHVAKPEAGYTAFFVELIYGGQRCARRAPLQMGGREGEISGDAVATTKSNRGLRGLRGCFLSASQSLTIILPMFSPRSRSMKACGARSSPSTTVSFAFNVPSAR